MLSFPLRKPKKRPLRGQRQAFWNQACSTSTVMRYRTQRRWYACVAIAPVFSSSSSCRWETQQPTNRPSLAGDRLAYSAAALMSAILPISPPETGSSHQTPWKQQPSYALASSQRLKSCEAYRKLVVRPSMPDRLTFAVGILMPKNQCGGYNYAAVDRSIGAYRAASWSSCDSDLLLYHSFSATDSAASLLSLS